MLKKIDKNKKIILFTISIIIFSLILRDILIYEVTRYDNWAYSVFVEELRNNNVTTIMKIITEFGNIYVILSIILLLYIFLKDKSKAYYSLLNIGIVIIINNIIKLIIQRPRPNGYNLINEANYSFPSGHAMISTAFYGFLIYLIYRNVTNKRIKYLLITLLFILIISICITRVYLGVHYLSDTIAGFSLSIAYLMIFITLLPKIESRLKK